MKPDADVRERDRIGGSARKVLRPGAKARRGGGGAG